MNLVARVILDIVITLMLKGFYHMVCSIEHNELPNGETLTSYGYTQPFINPNFTVVPMRIRMQYRYDGNYSYYRTSGIIEFGMSGGPNFTRNGRIGGMNKSVSLMEENTSNLVKSTEVVRMLRRNGVAEYPNTKNVDNNCLWVHLQFKEWRSKQCRSMYAKLKKQTYYPGN